MSVVSGCPRNQQGKEDVFALGNGLGRQVLQSQVVQIGLDEIDGECASLSQFSCGVTCRNGHKRAKSRCLMASSCSPCPSCLLSPFLLFLPASDHPTKDYPTLDDLIILPTPTARPSSSSRIICCRKTTTSCILTLGMIQ